MKVYKGFIFLMISAAVLLFGGCYIDPAADEQAGIAISISAKDIPSDYNGDMLKISLFLDGSVLLTDVNSDDLLYSTYLYYTVEAALPPVPFNGRPFEEFPIPSEEGSGTVRIEGIMPGPRYRLLVQLFYRGWEVSPWYDNGVYAGLSDPFEVIPGGNVDVNVELLQYSFC